MANTTSAKPLPKVYVINGSGGVGKDTFVSLAKILVPGGDSCIKNYSSISGIKDIAKQIGWHGEKSERGRKFLSDLKRICAEYNDYPYRLCEKFILSVPPSVKAVFIHVREPQEIEKIVKSFNARTILITNKNVKQITSNDSDGSVFEYFYDVTIKNDGTIIDFMKTVSVFLKNEGLIKEELR